MNSKPSFLTKAKNKAGVLALFLMAKATSCYATIEKQFDKLYPKFSYERNINTRLNKLEKKIKEQEQINFSLTSNTSIAYISAAKEIVALHRERIKILIRGHKGKGKSNKYVANYFHHINRQYCTKIFHSVEEKPQLMIKSIYANLSPDEQKAFMRYLNLQKNLLVISIPNNPKKQSTRLKEDFMILKELSWQNQFAVIISYYTIIATKKAPLVSLKLWINQWKSDIENNIEDLSNFVIDKNDDIYRQHDIKNTKNSSIRNKKIYLNGKLAAMSIATAYLFYIFVREIKEIFAKQVPTFNDQTKNNTTRISKNATTHTKHNRYPIGIYLLILLALLLLGFFLIRKKK